MRTGCMFRPDRAGSASRKHLQVRGLSGVRPAFAGAIFAVWTAAVGLGAESAKAPAPKKTDDGSAGDRAPALALPGASDRASEIFADRMEMDFNARVARFEGHVRVIDPRMTLTADTLIAYFTEDNRLRKVEALENVVIEQPDAGRRATAGHAVYDVAKGAIELTENPALQTGPNVLYGAAKITYFRDSERVICEGGKPRIRIQSQTGSKKLHNFLDKLGTPPTGEKKKK